MLGGGDADGNEEANAALGKFLDFAFEVWTFVTNLAFATVAAGFVLNLCGFGYRITIVPPTLTVRSLATVREETAAMRFFAKARDASLFESKLEANAIASKP